MKKIILLAIYVFISSCSSQKRTSQTLNSNDFLQQQIIPTTPSCDSDCVDRKKEFRYVAYVGEKIYCYWDEKQKEFNINFKSKAIEFENLITTTTTVTEYFLLLVKWASLFHDGHVNAMLGDDLSNIELYDVPIRLEILAGGTDHEKLIISKSNAALTNLKVGTVVEKIQGKNWKDLSLDAEKFVSGSTAQMRRRSAGQAIFRLLLETDGPTPVKIEGTFKSIAVSETVPRTLKLYDKSSPIEPPSTGLDMIQSSILENKIGYLRIDGFGGKEMRNLLNQSMDRLMKTDGLIIDVRKNGGGDLSGDVILSRLIVNPIERFSQRVNFSDMLQALRPDILFDYEYISGNFSDVISRPVRPMTNKQIYTKPVAVLTSSYCFSACDTFVSALQQNKLATVIGESTGGGTGNPQVIELPMSGHSFRYSVAQGYKANTTILLEGSGTTPDVIIEPTVDERILAKDLQLEKSVNYFSGIIHQPIIDQNSILPNQLLNITINDQWIPSEIELDQDIRRTNLEGQF